jgi:hypothetical protein
MSYDPLEQFLTPEERQKREQQRQQAQAKTTQQPQGMRAPEQGRPPELQGEQVAARPLPELDPRTGKEVYHAYHAQGRKSDRIEIRKAAAAWRAPAYRYLMDVTFNGYYETELDLIFTFYTIHIKGRHLDPIIYAIEDSRCVYIQDFHAEQFAPWLQGEPFIESITIDLLETKGR